MRPTPRCCSAARIFPSDRRHDRRCWGRGNNASVATAALRGRGPCRACRRKRNAIRGAFASEFIDMFDIYLPVVVLAPVLALFPAAEASAGEQAILSSLVFITTLLGRPIGGLLFGMVADRVGRRAASIYSVPGFGVVTLAIASLPGYETSASPPTGCWCCCASSTAFSSAAAIPARCRWRSSIRKSSERGFVGGLIIAAFCAAYLSIKLRRAADVRRAAAGRPPFAVCAMGLANSLRDRGVARLRAGTLLRPGSGRVGDLARQEAAGPGRRSRACCAAAMDAAWYRCC